MKSEISKLVDQCLADIRSGHFTLEQCLARYPEQAQELRPLLEIALHIQSREVTLSPQFKQRARLRLWQEMDKPPSRFAPAASLLFMILRPFHSVRTLAVLLPAVAILSFGGVLQAARTSLPDDRLHGFKTGLENLRLAATLDPVKKSELRIDLVESRIDEVLQMNRLGRPISLETLNCVAVCLQEALYDAAPASSQDHSELLERFAQVAGQQLTRLEDDADADDDDSSPAIKQVYFATQLSLDVASIARTDPEVLQTRIPLDGSQTEDGQFDLSGKLLIDDDGNWHIDNNQLKNVRPGDHPLPAEGAEVTIKGVALGGNTYITGIKPRETSESDGPRRDNQFIEKDEDSEGHAPVGTMASPVQSELGHSLENQGVEVSGTKPRENPHNNSSAESAVDTGNDLTDSRGNNRSNPKTQSEKAVKTPEKIVTPSKTAETGLNPAKSSQTSPANTQPPKVKDDSHSDRESENQGESHSGHSSSHDEQD